MRQIVFSAIVLIAVLSLCQPVHSTDVTRIQGRHLFKQAEMIFWGKVIDVSYGLSSKRSEEDEVLPHTFVTFEIIDVFKGTSESDTITLRFQGGPMQVQSDVDPQQTVFRYLMVSMVPLFDVGDQDILFVRGNGSRICPLAGLNRGRFRVIEDFIYSDIGLPIQLTDDISRTLPFLAEDIINPQELFARLIDPRTRLDEKIASLVSDQTREALAQALQSKPDSPEVRYAKTLLALDLNRATGIEEYLTMGEGRDAGEPLFSREELSDISLRKDTETLLTRDPALLTRTDLLRLNRFSLEDIYPNSIVRHLPRSFTTARVSLSELPPAVTDQVFTHQALCEGCNLRLTLGPGEDLMADSLSRVGKTGVKEPEGSSLFQEMPVEGMLTLPEFTAYLQESITALHTPEELGALPPVTSLDPRQEFVVRALTTPGAPTFDLAGTPLVDREPTRLELLEEEALAKSGYNPVLSEPRPEQ